MTRDPADVQALALDSVGPALVADSVSFYAVYGENRFGELYLADSLGLPGETLLRFEVGAYSLHKSPEGDRYRSGDSVLITIRAADAQRLDFDFEPSGLRFRDDWRSARLTVQYGRALANNGGLAGNEKNLAIWVQEHANEYFRRVETVVDTANKVVTGNIPGFSKYAVAY